MSTTVVMVHNMAHNNSVSSRQSMPTSCTTQWKGIQHHIAHMLQLHYLLFTSGRKHRKRHRRNERQTISIYQYIYSHNTEAAEVYSIARDNGSWPISFLKDHASHTVDNSNFTRNGNCNEKYVHLNAFIVKNNAIVDCMGSEFGSIVFEICDQ